jgi:hypothetical protein
MLIIKGVTIMGTIRKDVSLTRIFLKARILTLDQLCEKMQCSQPTVFRRLCDHGYYSSYNHAGKFFAIDEVAHFDSRDLWMCKGARFSKHGNLKMTVSHFVKESKKGKTHAELLAILGVRSHNTLLNLVQEGSVKRDKVGSSYVYLNVNRAIHKRQVSQRENYLESQKKSRASGHNILDFYARELATLDERADKIMVIIDECLPGPIIADKT